MTTETAPTLTLADLRDFEGTLYVENLTANHVTCNDLATKRTFALGPAGRDDAIQVLPKEVAETAGFQRLWLRGAVAISADPSMQEKLLLSAEARVRARADEQAKLQAVMEPAPALRNLVERRCLISGERVFQTEQEVKDLVPPLAERYKDRAHEFVPTEVMENGEVKLVWNTATVEG